jgi:Tat protein secretion system quality control protein TatD with DNase activity
MFVDTHCNLDAAEFGDTQAELVRAAHAAGVSRIVVPSVDRANFGIHRRRRVLRLALEKRRPRVSTSD